MEYEFRDGKLLVSRTEKERAPIVHRLRRIEGQIRGLIQMIEADRYCLDEVQVANAITSATREAALMILASHLDAAVDYAMKSGKTGLATEEVINVMRAALKL